mmetsp:Transcript_39955/g.91887  ORF Transcript_39955/g.91887 Transcript_39955/m.91887 type:complete len:202 (+) Transcript_39955:322-927(+)
MSLSLSLSLPHTPSPSLTCRNTHRRCRAQKPSVRLFVVFLSPSVRSFLSRRSLADDGLLAHPASSERNTQETKGEEDSEEAEDHLRVRELLGGAHVLEFRFEEVALRLALGPARPAARVEEGHDLRPAHDGLDRGARGVERGLGRCGAGARLGHHEACRRRPAGGSAHEGRGQESEESGHTHRRYSAVVGGAVVEEVPCQA